MSAWPTFPQSAVAGSPCNQDFHRSIATSGCSKTMGRTQSGHRTSEQQSRGKSKRSPSPAGCHLPLPAVTKVWCKVLAQAAFLSHLSDGRDRETCSSLWEGQQRESPLNWQSPTETPCQRTWPLGPAAKRTISVLSIAFFFNCCPVHAKLCN